MSRGDKTNSAVLIGVQENSIEPLVQSKRDQLLKLVAQLAEPEVSLESRLVIIDQLRDLLKPPGGEGVELFSYRDDHIASPSIHLTGIKPIPNEEKRFLK